MTCPTSVNAAIRAAGMAALFISASAFAQAPTEQQMQQAQTAMFQAEAQFFSLAAQRLQKQLSDAQAELDYWRKYNAPVSPHAANEGKAR